MCTSCVALCIACVFCMWMKCVKKAGHMLIGITCLDQTCIDQVGRIGGVKMSGVGIACECFNYVVMSWSNIIITTQSDSTGE